MATSLETNINEAGTKEYGARLNPVALAWFDATRQCFLIAFPNDPLGWGTKECHAIETCDWLALAYASELKATGH